MGPCTFKVPQIRATELSEESSDYRHCEEPTGPAFGGPDDKLRDEAIQTCVVALDCSAEPVIGRAFARPVGSQSRLAIDWLSRSMRRSCAAMETMPPENPPPSAAPLAGGEGSGADWDPVR